MIENILLTGSSGFIGRHIINNISALDKQYRIFGFSSGDSSGANIKYNPLHNFKSIFNSLKIDKIDFVIHCGAFTPKNPNEANSFENNFNIISTINLLQSLPSLPQKIIYISTLDVYQKSDEIISETSKVNPLNLYSRSKYYCEELLVNWGIENNVIVQVLRVGHIYGPGEERYQKLIPTIIKNVKNNIRPTLYNNGVDLRSFLYIEDCVQSIINALKLSDSVGIINIVSKFPYTVKEITELIIEISGKKIIPNYISVEGLKSTNWIFDNQKMEKYLHVERIGIKEGLSKEFNLSFL